VRPPLLIDEVTNKQLPFFEPIQLDRLYASFLLAKGIQVMARSFIAIDNALSHLDANLRLLLRPHAFQDLPGIVLWFAYVFDTQAIGRNAAVMGEKALFVASVPAVDLTVQEVLDCVFVHTHLLFILG
jgi:hypothetical protein